MERSHRKGTSKRWNRTNSVENEDEEWAPLPVTRNDPDDHDDNNNQTKNKGTATTTTTFLVITFLVLVWCGMGMATLARGSNSRAPDTDAITPPYNPNNKYFVSTVYRNNAADSDSDSAALLAAASSLATDGVASAAIDSDYARTDADFIHDYDTAAVAMAVAKGTHPEFPTACNWKCYYHNVYGCYHTSNVAYTKQFVMNHYRQWYGSRDCTCRRGESSPDDDEGAEAGGPELVPCKHTQKPKRSQQISELDGNGCNWSGDWECYFRQNPDLTRGTGDDEHERKKAKRHYRTKGKPEGRTCACIPNVPSDQTQAKKS